MSKKRETRGERQRRLAAKALAAQESGEWDPAPAGASSAADSEAAEKRREWAQAVGSVQSAKDWARFQREMLDLAKANGESGQSLEIHRDWIKEAEAEVAEAEAELEKLRKKRKAAS